MAALSVSWAAPRPGFAADRLTIGATQTALLVWIAEARGLFRQQGLDIEAKMFSSGLEAADALIKGEVDFSTSSDAVLAGNRFNNPDLRILAVISTSESARLIGRKDRGIRKPGDLAGKRIGITLSTAGEFLFTRYLSLHGIPATAPVVVDLRPEEIVADLTSGSIDAGLTWEPFVGDAEQALQANAVILPEQLEQFFYFLLLTREDLIEQQTDKIQKILRSLIAAESYASNNPSDAQDVIKSEFKYPESQIHRLWTLHRLHISLPQGLLFKLEEKTAWQVKKGLATAKTPHRFPISFPRNRLQPSVREASVS